jgi:hypothetical protein
MPAHYETNARLSFPATPQLNFLATAPTRASFISELAFKPIDFVSEPLFEDLFALAGIHRGDRSVLAIEWNVVARDIFTPARLGNILHENALTTRMGTQWISKVQTMSES